MTIIKTGIPEKLRHLLDRTRKARYRVAYGGRGSGKSIAFARIFLIDAIENPGPRLCARELQVSIRDSVHRLLISQVEAMGLQDLFDYGESYFRSRSGSDFIFKGLRSNINEIKSLEGIRKAWIEEAQGVSERSWEVLIPTIRTPGSEIWLSFNPDSADDATYKRFVLNPPPGTLIEKVNYYDNPFFPPELEAERAFMERTDPDAHAHIWEGGCRSHSQAQIFSGKWRVGDIPDDKPADADGPYFGADWGFSQDPTALIRCYIHAGRLYITHEAFRVGCETDHLPTLFDTIEGSRSHVIRADCSRPETISYMARQGFQIRAADKWGGSVEDGITRMKAFEEIVIHPRCRSIIDEFRLYSYKVDRLSGDILTEIIDKHNHGIDAIRYALQPIIKSGNKVMIGRA